MSHTRRRFLQSVALGTGAMALDRSSAFSDGAEKKEAAAETGKTTAASASPQIFAQGAGFEEAVIYRPAKRPGYSAWVAPWRGPDGALFLSFVEKRRLPNPFYRPIPLDFWEAMSVPIKYQASFLAVADVLTESVVLRSQDEAKSWVEVGRSATNEMNLFCYMSLPDGSMIRGINNAYLAYYANEPVACSIQRSTDMGNTWKDLAVVGEDLCFYPYRLLGLRDGAIVLLGGYQDAFGPGRPTPYRNYSPGNIRFNFQAAISYSYDQGASWVGPVPVLPGVYAPEPDLVELPSGDLLLINSSVQSGANTREIVRRQGKRFVPQPVFDITVGSVPETFIVTKGNLLVGTRRGGIYSCSNDLGSTWYEIGGLPKSLYQPRIVPLADGRLCNFFHFGGDNIVGEVDQYIGKHVFRLEEHLPAPTKLVITRDRNAAGTQYLNAYTATLAAGAKALPGQEVTFTVRASSMGRKSYTTDKYPRRTDAAGRAHLALPAFDTCLDIHRDYTVQAEFTPAPGDTALAAATSSKYGAYRMNPTAGKKDTYAFYLANKRLFVLPEILERLPELDGLVKNFGLKPGFTRAELLQTLSLRPARATQILDILIQHNVLEAGRDDSFLWNEVEVKEVRPITIADDFLA